MTEGPAFQGMAPNTEPLSHLELFSAIAHYAREIARLTAAVPVACAPEPPQPGAKESIRPPADVYLSDELLSKYAKIGYGVNAMTIYNDVIRMACELLERRAHETTDLNSCRARLHDISNGPLYDLQMSARREVGLAIDEARTALARACHDLRRATTVAASSVGTASTPPLKAAAPPAPVCTCTPASYTGDKNHGCFTSGRIDPKCPLHWRETLIQNTSENGEGSQQ